MVVSPSSVYQTIFQLRKALGDTQTPPSYIEKRCPQGLSTHSRPSAPVPPAIAPAACSSSRRPCLPGPRLPRSRWGSSLRFSRDTFALATGLVAIFVAVVLDAAAASWPAREAPADSIPWPRIFLSKTSRPARRSRCSGATA